MNATLLDIIVALICISLGIIIGNLLGKIKANKIIHDSEKNKNILQNKLDNLVVQKTEIEKFISKQKEEFEDHLDQKNNEINTLRSEKDFSSIELVKKNEELKNLHLKLKENKEEIGQLQEKFTKEFENLANKILDEKSNKFTIQNKENLQNILNPLQEKIKTFEKKVEDTQKESIERVL